jgi:hypothetical protein
MSKGRAPAPPDYVGAAQLQGEMSKEALNMQNYANRPVQNTPFGSTTWGTEAVIDPATGQEVTQWTQNTTLAPGLQSALESQIGLQQDRSDLASGFMDRVASEYGRPFDWNNLPAMTSAGTPGQLQTRTADYSPGLATEFNFGGAPALPQYDANFRNQVANDLMEQMLPVQRMQQQALETDLSNRGFQQGTEAYKRALDQLNQRQSSERYNALNMAGQEAQRLYGMQMGSRQQGVNEAMAQGNFRNQALGQASGMDLSRMGAMNAAQAQQFGLNQQYADQMNRLRQQAIAEQMQRRGMSLNEMNALLTGQQVGMPQMPTFNASGRAETPNILGATQMGYNAAMDQYNAQQAGASNLMGGLFSLGSAAISNPFMFSDRRLKRNIKRVGTHSTGVGLYEYDVAGYRQRGVIAQELEAVRPDLVRRHPSGYLTVNYGAL